MYVEITCYDSNRSDKWGEKNKTKKNNNNNNNNKKQIKKQLNDKNDKNMLNPMYKNKVTGYKF